METPWMTIEECSSYLRCSLRYLREKVANREIPSTTFGGKALFHRERIDEWMLSQEEGSGPAAAMSSAAAAGSAGSDIETTIVPGCNRDEVNALVQRLIDFDEHFVTSLGKNLRSDLDEYEYRKLSPKVYAQLSRWCHPHRNTQREQVVKPITHQISTLLFDRVIDRTKHPSYGS